jgi:DNA-binding PadR family transcriptional regulator
MGLSTKEHLILQVLNRNELSGVRIAKNLADLTNSDCEPGVESLYPILHKLEKQALIESR